MPAPAAPRVEARTIAPNLTVATPHLAEGMAEEAVEAALRALLDEHLGTDRPDSRLVLYADDAAFLAAYRGRLHRL